MSEQEWFSQPQYWLAEVDSYGTGWLKDGAHSTPEGVAKALYLYQRFGFNEGKRYARPNFRECHHVGNDYVEVHWDDGFKDWVVRYATVGKRGSMSAFASKELDYMIERLREQPASTEGEA